MLRFRAVVTLVCALLLGLPAAEAGLAVQQRKPFALLLITPQGDVARMRSSEIISYFSEKLRHHTNFEVQVVDSGVGTACKGEVGCMVRRIRTDYDRLAMELPDGTVDPYQSHLDRLERQGESYPRYLLVLSNFVEAGKADRMLAMLIDTDKALEIFHTADRKKPDWQQDAEDLISDKAVIQRPKRAELQDKAETERYLDRLIDDHIRLSLEKSGDWEPFGSVELTGVAVGAEVRVDGMTIGTTSNATEVIADVPHGSHRLEVVHPDYEPFAKDIQVERRQQTQVEVALAVKISESSGVFRDAVFWGGVGTAAIGTAVTVLALVKASSGAHQNVVCIEGFCEVDSEFLGLSGSDGSFVDPQQEGLLIAPLGYSLIGAGGAWSLGTLFLTEEGEAPWIPLVAGLVLGGASYGLSAALNP